MQVTQASQGVDKYEKTNCNLENINFLLYLPYLNENESYVTIWIIHLIMCYNTTIIRDEKNQNVSLWLAIY